VRLARTVTALAAVRRFGRARILRLRVGGSLERVAVVFVADETGVAAGVARRRRLSGLGCRGSGGNRRAWLARRQLPWPLGALYVAGFALRTLPRLRARRDAQQALRGYRDGLQGQAGERHTLSARTLWRMTRAGRPPVI